MRLGILNAVTPADEATFGLREFDSFQHFLGQVPHDLTLVEFRVTEGELPTAQTACDAYLVTGSPAGVYDHAPWIAPLADFLRVRYAAGQKLVGICFGHQLLAHALGGHAERSTNGWGMGLRRFTLTQQRSWMVPAVEQGQLYFCHQDQVVRLPAQAEHLGGDTFCPNTVFAIGDQVLGIQGHPEFTEGVMRVLIEQLGADAGEGVKAQARISLGGGAADNVTVAHWIINFLTQ